MPSFFFFSLYVYTVYIYFHTYWVMTVSHYPPQAFSIPVIQIVYETLKDQQEGKKGRASIKTGGASENI